MGRLFADEHLECSADLDASIRNFYPIVKVPKPIILKDNTTVPINYSIRAKSDITQSRVLFI